MLDDFATGTRSLLSNCGLDRDADGDAGAHELITQQQRGRAQQRTRDVVLHTAPEAADTRGRVNGRYSRVQCVAWQR